MKLRRWAVAVGLACMATVSPSASVVDALIGALGDPEPAVRAQAAWALGEIGAREAIPALVAALDDSEPEVVEEAVKALRGLSPLPTEAIQALLGLLKRCDPFHDFLLMYEISEAMAGTSREAVPILIQTLEHPDPEVRSHVALALGKANAREAIRPIGELLLVEEDRWVRERLFHALCYFDPPGEAILYLRAAIEREPGPVARASLLQSMGLMAPHLGDPEAFVPVLIAALEDPEPEVRTSAAYALKWLGSAAADAAPYVLDLVREGGLDPWVELGLPRVLAAFGSPAVPVLVEALRDENPHVRIVSLYALEEMGVKAASAASAVTEVLHEDPDPGVRAAAAQAMTRISPDVMEAIGALMVALDDHAEEMWDAARKALCDLGPEAVAPLEELIAGDLELEVKLELISALGCLGKEGYTALVRALTYPDPHIRARAAAVLEETVFSLVREYPLWEIPDWACNEELIPALMAVVDAPLPEVRRAAATALAWCAGEAPNEIAPVLAKLLRDPDPGVLTAAVVGLAGVGALAEIALKDLIAALDHPSPEVKGYAAMALGNVGPAAAEAVPKLVELLESAEDEQLISHVLVSLARIGTDEAFTAVVTRLDDQDPWVRAQAVAALALFGPTAIPEISRALEDKHVALTAVEALAWVGPEAVPVLVEALGHPDDRVRAAAATALGKFRAEEAVPVLIDIVVRGEDRKMVVKAAMEALLRIGLAAMPHLLELLSSPDPAARAFAARTMFAIESLSSLAPWAAELAGPYLTSPVELEELPIPVAITDVPPDPGTVLKEFLGAEPVELTVSALNAVIAFGNALAELMEITQWRWEKDLTDLGDLEFAHEWPGPLWGMIYLMGDRPGVEALELLNEFFNKARREAIVDMAGVFATAIQEMLAELVPAVEASLGHESGEVRILAAEALGSIGRLAERAVPALLGCLGDPEPEVRARAAWALGKILKHERSGDGRT